MLTGMAEIVNVAQVVIKQAHGASCMGSVARIQSSDVGIVLEIRISASLKTIYPATHINPTLLLTFSTCRLDR